MIGYALATALAAPVEDGMMLAEAARPARQSPFMLPSTVSCEAVAACTVVMRPCLMPNFSLTTLTMVGVSASFAGAEMITFLAPPARCRLQPSVVVNAPLDSQTYSTPVDAHGISVGSRVAERVTFSPLMTSASPSISHVPLKRPCTVSCSSWYFMYSGAMGELMCLTENASRSMAMRTTWRPMRPKPLTPSLISPDIMTGAVYAMVSGAKAASMVV